MHKSKRKIVLVFFFFFFSKVCSRCTWTSNHIWFTEQIAMGSKSGLIMKLQMVITYHPTLFEDFVQLVIPVLQKCGIFREDYEGTTLRDI